MAVLQSRQVADFEQILGTSLENFINASSVLGEPVTSLALKVKDAFLRARDLIQYGLSNQEPSQDSPVMESYFTTIKGIVDFKEAPNSPFSNHFATVREAICALGWISVKPAPQQFVRDMREAGEYYANRVLLSNKGNQQHMDWVNKWNQLLVDLQKFVAQHFLTGFTWGAGNMAVGRGGPPPPPPPPPPEFDQVVASGDGQRQALLNDLNQGADITRNLKPVNRSAPAAGHGPAVRSAGSAVKAATAAKVYPPKLLLEGRKWVVEHQKNNPGLSISNDDMSQSLSMFKCEDSGLQVANKMNGVVVDSCKRSTVVLKSIISSVELIRCERVKIQCDGNVPLINLDNCDSIQIFVTPASRNVEIISSKSNSCNVCILEPDGDYKEISIPEQIKTVLVGKKLESTVVEKI